VDLRLRPQGGKGPVASQFRGFVSYQRSEAELWEHMALTRARVLAGDEELGRRVALAVKEIVHAERDPRHVFAEVRAMRELIAKEKGDANPWDFKLARGGLTDLDFIAQALVLAFPTRIGVPPGAATDQVLRQACEAGLLSREATATAADAYRLFSDLFHWQRLMIEGAFDVSVVPPAILKRLASVAGQPSVEACLAQSQATRREIADLFDAVLTAPAATPG
jgi:[glutamine synthetase] adenylyltransferase / [glutamine synthetase]-adenylyl-L-tyrosine phosphorylase